jgi:hypothetical protein
MYIGSTGLKVAPTRTPGVEVAPMEPSTLRGGSTSGQKV